MPDDTMQWTGPLAVAGASALFATTGLFVTAAGDVPLTGILAVRFGVGVLALAAIAVFRHYFREPWRPEWRFLPHYLALGVSILALTGLYFGAILRVGMGLATILLSTTPAFVVLANWMIWKMRPKRRVLASLGVGFTGVVLIVHAEGAHGDVLGVLAGLAAAIAHATWLIVSRDAALKGSWSETQSGMSAVMAAAIILPIAAFTLPAAPPAHAMPWLIGLGLVPGAVAITLLSRGLQKVDAARASILTYVEPVTAVALGVLVLEESLTRAQALGSLLVLAGMLMVSVNRRRLRRRHAREAILRIPHPPPKRRRRRRSVHDFLTRHRFARR